MDMRAIRQWAVVVFLAVAGGAAATERSLTLEAYQTALLQSEGHPNEINRWHGLWHYDNDRNEEARKYFVRAAEYGDKLSQHFLSLMYWNGDGVDRDPVQAYVWADLAAERGNNDELLRVRESMWRELTPAQQAQSREIGGGYYDRYGDATAQRRTDAQIRRFSRNQTGTRAGALTSRLEVNMGRPELWAGGGQQKVGPLRSTGTEFYRDDRTRPTEYWQAEDVNLVALMKQIDAGTVRVRDVDVVRDPPSPDDD